MPKAASTEPKSAVFKKVLTYKHMKGFKQIDDIKTKYTLGPHLGSGSFGTVVEGVHALAQTPVAIKMIRKEKINHEIYMKLAMQEFKVLEGLDHPHIVRVLELLEDETCYYVVMELINHGTLLDFLNDCARERRPLSEQ